MCWGKQIQILDSKHGKSKLERQHWALKLKGHDIHGDLRSSDVEGEVVVKQKPGNAGEGSGHWTQAEDWTDMMMLSHTPMEQQNRGKQLRGDAAHRH